MNEEMVTRRLTEMVGELAGVSSQLGDDGDRVDVITVLEKLKAAAAAAQLGVVNDFAASQEAANRALGAPARVARRGVPEQVGFARKVAPATAARQVTQARALRDEMPEAFRLLAAGEISEWVATIVVTETSHLAAEDRRLVDKHLAAELAGLSPKRAQARAKKLAYEADPEGTVNRTGNARKDRRVSMRPAPDAMAMLSALLPAEQGVAAWAALRRHADRLVGSGDGRTRDQIMADTVYERLTGKATAEDVDAEIALIMNESTLFDGDNEPADLVGYGPIPAETARDIARRASSSTDHAGDGGETGVAGAGRSVADDTAGCAPAESGTELAEGDAEAAGAEPTGGGEPEGVGSQAVGECTPALGMHHPGCRRNSTGPDGVGRAVGAEQATRARIWLRRLVTDPITGIVIDCDPRKRRFDGTLARMLVYRDQRCRNPYCDAPIRHLDHIQPAAQGGPTTPSNGRGLCELCNYVAQMPGWSSRVIDEDRHLIEITTPTGHTYRSPPPTPPGTRRRRAPT